MTLPGMTGELRIDYEALAQDAMRGIMRTVLLRVAAVGRLPGEHHFYIGFDTRAPGVVLSKRLKAKYPEEMTIVLQHQFWDLTVDDERFEVTLSFDNMPERLTVPLRAVRVFFDPSVPYGFQFETSDLAGGPTGETVPREPDAAVPATAEAAAPAKVRTARRPHEDDGAAEPAAAAADSVTETAGQPAPRRQPGRPKLVKPKPDQPASPANDAKVVQLDKFRKR